MKRSFDLQSNCDDYIVMDAKVFYMFFIEMARLSDVDDALLKEIDKQYRYSRFIKRKRIRLKKEKEMLILMAYLLESFCSKTI